MFLSRLLVEAADEPGFWILRAPLVWCCETHGNIGVPVGFVTDLASIPVVAQTVPGFHPNGLTRRPAVLHDFLYATQRLSKTVADKVFHEAMLADRVDPQVALGCYNAVSIFGRQAWDQHAARMAALRGAQGIPTPAKMVPRQ